MSYEEKEKLDLSDISFTNIIGSYENKKYLENRKDNVSVKENIQVILWIYYYKNTIQGIWSKTLSNII